VPLSITILGCGSSGGVPRVASGWGVCDPWNPRNRRRRCSILVRRSGPGGTTNVLVDTSPDLREQMLDAEVDRLDGVLFTHDHADHTHGIDDLRPFVIQHRRRLDIWADAPTAATLHARFGYVFSAPAGSDYPPILNEHRLEHGRPAVVGGPGGAIEAVPFQLDHGNAPALGFRFGGLAYTPDVSAIPDESLDFLRGLDVWIIDALRRRPHPTHFSLDEALGWIERMAPARAVVTNLHNDLDYGELTRELPPDVVPAYDGLTIEVAA
jgi:phosphoribosyl 1,2-cyclic phosphate phosphodiesterase